MLYFFVNIKEIKQYWGKDDTRNEKRTKEIELRYETAENLYIINSLSKSQQITQHTHVCT